MNLVMLPLAMALAAAAPPQDPPPEHCAIGAYSLPDGSFVDVAPADGAALRWRRPDGTTGALAATPGGGWASTLGWTGRPDGVQVSFDCARDTIVFDGRRGERMKFDVAETRFEVDGAVLAGRLIMPPGDQPVPVVVLVHGAERMSAREAYALQRMFPAAGIGAFVYDKRGTGASTGQYTHDYATLATDAISAADEARRLGGSRISRIGYQAGSQGGWVAPLAAQIDPVDFIIVSFGLAVSPAAAERELIVAALRRHGFGPEAIAGAMEISQAVEAVIDSNFQSGYDRLADVRDRYADEPWFAHAGGSFVGMILGMPPEQLRREGPKLAPNISLYYDPLPVLRNLDTPQLWILAEEDLVAPVAGTSRRLAELEKAGRPITTAIFADAEHGMYGYEIAADGSRVSTRAPEGYFPMMRDYVLTGRTGPRYGARILNSAAGRE
ncbi:S9 family peptidase [Sphingosinicella sp. CPCC 101087]|uniref:alpha/beta hydrolase family protein n=1 Tax=Sphingosinicella sp. CPCC 101087 TaxID=2497754 RepID=UPI00101C82BB|nr:alpha/beta hydrolase [Sphingosinicella sp. CPCC 101087]